MKNKVFAAILVVVIAVSIVVIPSFAGEQKYSDAYKKASMERNVREELASNGNQVPAYLSSYLTESMERNYRDELKDN